MVLHMLTTVDNPFSPVTQYDAWDAWDRAQGYCTNALLARIVRTSDEISEADQVLAIENAIEEIVRENVSGMHMRVVLPEKPAKVRQSDGVVAGDYIS